MNKTFFPSLFSEGRLLMLGCVCSNQSAAKRCTEVKFGQNSLFLSLTLCYVCPCLGKMLDLIVPPLSPLSVSLSLSLTPSPFGPKN
jgi:hypothetical protein